MKISIGVLARNEAGRIGTMLRSLVRQSCFWMDAPAIEVEIVVVPNGCTDTTAAVAQMVLAESVPCLPHHVRPRWLIHEVERPGKSNAWNHFVHDLAAPNADFLILADADIEFVEPGTITSMLDLLQDCPEAWVAVDQPIKDVAFKRSKMISAWLSVNASRLSGRRNIPSQPSWLCGQLYAARADRLRTIWLPTELPTQDSFLYNMIVTGGLRHEACPARVLLAANAAHVFEAYTTLNRLLRHERWLMQGAALNELVYNSLAIEREPHREVGLVIQRRNQVDPRWLTALRSAAAERQRWLIPRAILGRRFASLQQRPWSQRLAMLPLALLAFLVDLFVAFQANRQLHRSEASDG